MSENNKCSIIQDLLPNYIEGLISDESKKCIENHLENCNECKKIFYSMKKDLEKDVIKLDKEVKYAKKYNRKIKFLILVIIALCLLIISFTFFRNVIIIKLLSDKAKNYDNVKNYHLMWSTYSKEQTRILDIYYNNGKYIETSYSYDFSKYNEDKNLTKVIRYCDGSDEIVSIFCNEKIIQKNKKMESSEYPTMTPKSMTYSSILYENLSDLLKLSFSQIITTEKCNSIDCYRIRFSTNDRNSICIDRKTGLTLRMQGGFIVENNYSDYFSDFMLEVDVVTDEDIAFPDIDEYNME